MLGSLKPFVQVIKPGIVLSNLLTAFTGAYIAVGKLDLVLFLVMLGISMIIASAAVVNNLMDVDIDCLMSRTKNRVSVLGTLPKEVLVVYASILFVFGNLLLMIYTNPLTLWVMAIGYLVYILWYSWLLKRSSVYSTIVGAISGAVPPMAGYLAFADRLDAVAWVLFGVLFIWQIPHFYAIGIYRLQDYIAAKIPILPVSAGVYRTKQSILFWTILFALFITVPILYGWVGLGYLMVVPIIAFGWVISAIWGMKTLNDALWARRHFIYSILVIVTFCVMSLISWN